MRRIGFVLIGCVGVAGLAGCGSEGGGPAKVGGLAVVDLDLLAKRLGRTEVMNAQIQERQNNLNLQLAAAQKTFQDKFDEKREQFGEQLTDEQTKELQSTQVALSSRLVQAQRQAQSNLAVYRQRLIAGFRAEVRPIAQKIAAERGLAIVVPRNENLLLSIDPGVDITEEVLAVMQTTAPAPPAQKSNSEPKPKAPAENEAPQTANKPIETATE